MGCGLRWAGWGFNSLVGYVDSSRRLNVASCMIQWLSIMYFVGNFMSSLCIFSLSAWCSVLMFLIERITVQTILSVSALNILVLPALF